jgi:glycosyl transferase family 25
MRLSGVDGNDVDWSTYLSPDALEKLMTVQRTGFRADHPDLTAGAVGCYLSHLQAWQHIASSGGQTGLVFEDDADIPSDALSKTVDLMRKVPADWDIVLLGYEGGGSFVASGVVRVPRFLRTHAYVIKTACAKRLGTEMLPIRKQLDWQLSDMIRDKKLNVYGALPKLVDVAYQGTDIQVPIK